MALKVVPLATSGAMSTIGASRRSTSVRHVSREFRIESVSPAATRRARARRALRSWRSGIHRKVLIGVGVAVLIAGVIL